MCVKTWRSSLALCWVAATAEAVTCEDITHRNQSFTTCTVDLATDTLSLHLNTVAGAVIGSFRALDAMTDTPLQFGMNAGMYHQDRSPVGLFTVEGETLAPLITSAGPGNFGLLPNGVLCLQSDAAHVIETLQYAATQPACHAATQSGPMLVIDGALHPRFIPDGTSRKIRNGVGTSADGQTAVFAISNQPVNFHDFGTLFRDHLALPNALFLDGSISRLFAKDLNRHDPGFQMGPMIAVFE